MTDALHMICADASWLPAHAAWAEGQFFQLPDGLISSRGMEQPKIESAARLRERRAFTDRRPWSSRLPLSYQLVPHQLRSPAQRG